MYVNAALRARQTSPRAAGLVAAAGGHFTPGLHERRGHARHFGVEFDSFSNSLGGLTVISKVEHVKDSPRATGFRVGLITRF